MKWRCALIQRRLPDYPDGDLSPFWKRQVASHLEVCPDCRQEAAALGEVLSLYRACPSLTPSLLSGRISSRSCTSSWPR